MINYELAKKLKDNGFPQEGMNDFNNSGNIDYDKNNGYLFAPNGTIQNNPKGPFRDEVMYPTLSELIEACGEEIYDLTRTIDGWRTNMGSDVDSQFSGKFPEEAVANLWLKIHEK